MYVVYARWFVGRGALLVARGLWAIMGGLHEEGRSVDRGGDALVRGMRHFNKTVFAPILFFTIFKVVMNFTALFGGGLMFKSLTSPRAA